MTSLTWIAKVEKLVLQTIVKNTVFYGFLHGLTNNNRFWSFNKYIETMTISNEDLWNKFIEIERLLKKLVRGETKEKDEFLTTKQFLEKENFTKRQYYYILEKHPEIKGRRTALGLLINYTKFQNLKR